MRFETCFTARFIAWDEITKVEKRRRLSRSGYFWDVRVHFDGGKKRSVPGAFTTSSSEKSRRVLEQQFACIREYQADFRA